MSIGEVQPCERGGALLSDFNLRNALGRWRVGDVIRGFLSEEQAKVLIQFGAGRFVLSQVPPNWCLPTIERIAALGDLPANWDSYQAQPVDPECAKTAIQIVLSMLTEVTPEPAVVPTSRGGVQLEWHCGGIDLEIAINAPNSVHVFFEDLSIGQMSEQTLSGDFRPLAPLLDRVPATG